MTDATSHTRRSLLLQILRYVPAALIPAVSGLLLVRSATSLLEPEQYGTFAVVAATVALGVALASQWLRSGIGRFFPPAQAAQREALKSSAALGIALVALVLGAAGLALLASGVVGGAWRPFLVPALLLAVVHATYESLVVVLQSEMRASRFSVYRGGEAALRLLLAVALLLAWRSPVSLIWAGLGSSALLLPLLWRDAKLPSPYRLLARAKIRALVPGLGQLARFGVPLIGWYGASLVLNLGDRYVIEYFRGDREVGIYSAGYQLIHGAMGLVTAPIVFASHPFLMQAWNPDQAERAGRWLSLIFERLAIGGLLLLAGVWLFRDDLMRLGVGSAFREGARILTPVFLGELLWSLGMYAHKPHEFFGRTRTMLVWAIGCALLNLGLNVLLVPVYGYVAAAWVTAASYGLYLAIAFQAGQPLLRWKPDWALLAASALGALGLAAAIHWSRQGLAGALGDIPALLGSLALFGLVAAAVGLRVLGVELRLPGAASRTETP
jgi:O-antigen/teichoic acid export membrane protein